jgi:hypothetical protein
MIFPIGDDQVKGGPRPLFSYGFILLNVLVFFYFQLPNTAFTYGYLMVMTHCRATFQPSTFVLTSDNKTNPSQN